ncbi:hypothetical protein OBP_072 [Pseudomonas phage OBP]|uniref:hypothetical protein n=1 Tax=Pseudomonas phage OBP TaxID=1124849 RepID=UPI000240D426|nr:hypothetical protein OBP_072 [Pseudomonas phage OBP]AEV89509.1 hypothetical protein OBP_072 [Pseudomonas phage OBP]
MPVAIPYGNSYYYTDEFKTIIRSCKEILLSQAAFSAFADDSIKFAYKYNFHKFLRNLGGDNPTIPEELIWVTSFINNMENPNADFTKIPGLFTVTKEQVDSVIQVTRVRRE